MYMLIIRSWLRCLTKRGKYDHIVLYRVDVLKMAVASPHTNMSLSRIISHGPICSAGDIRG